jgi:nucleoside-diphosphate-sugar epimerase
LKIFITGATGLLGRYLSRKCLAQGDQVISIYREKTDFTLIADIKEKIEWEKADLFDVLALRTIMERVDVVIHAAGLVTFSPSQADNLYKVNVEGTANMVNAALMGRPPRFIHISSIAAIGRDKKQTLIDENTKWKASDRNSQYAVSKYEGECEVWRGFEEGLEGLIFNPSIILAPGDWHKSSASIFRQVHQQSLFYPEGYANVVDVRDVVETVYKGITSNLSKERFILNKGEIHFKDLIGQIAHIYGKKKPKIGLSYQKIRIFAPFIKLLSLFTSSSSIDVIANLKSLQHRYTYINEKVKAYFHVSFTPIEETVRWASEQIVEKYKLRKGSE